MSFFVSRRRGFTLIELLVTMSIIGLLSTVGMVSYDSARRSSRDAKRVSDAKQVQQSLEIYFEYHDGYPADGAFGQDGLVLGSPETSTLSDAGFAPETEGTVFLVGVPANPQPNGTPYVYRSLQRDGRDCDYAPCESYAIYYTLEGATGSQIAGVHALTPDGLVGPEGGSAKGVAGVGFAGGLDVASAALGDFALRAFSSWSEFAANETVEAVAEAAVAPVATVVTAASLAIALQSVASTALFGQYLIFFLMQPLLFLTRGRRRQWGTVYNVLSRLPEDLAIVRLRQGSRGNRIIRSEVTDKNGRFSFLVPTGDYRIEAIKSGFIFPSELTAGRDVDGPYLDIYHGEVLEVGSEGAALTPNLPLDPIGVERPDDAVRRAERRRQLRESLAKAGPLLGALALVIKPSLLVGLMFGLQLLIFAMFRRMATPHRPKGWGVVFDESSRRPVAQAVVRVFSLPYNKLLDTRVTDARGRYNFRVGVGKYYLTITKAGYVKTESEPLEFSPASGAAFIASDLPLRPVAYRPPPVMPPRLESADAPTVRPEIKIEHRDSSGTADDGRHVPPAGFVA